MSADKRERETLVPCPKCQGKGYSMVPITRSSAPPQLYEGPPRHEGQRLTFVREDYLVPAARDARERSGAGAARVEERQPGKAPMTPLTGLGIWIWELPKCEGGNVPAILAKAKVWRLVRPREGGRRDHGRVRPSPSS